MSKKIGKYIGGVIGAAGALVAGTVLLPEIGAGLLLSGAGEAVVDIIVAACSNAGIAATTTAATAIGAKIGNEVDKAKEKNEQKYYTQGEKDGTKGMENMKKCHQEEMKAKNEECKKKDEKIKNQEEYIKNQDEFINDNIL